MKNNSLIKNKITIIGAGLVGSLWAVLLRRNNFDVDIFEKRSDLRKQQNDSGRSINLIITSRGLHALKTANLLEEAIKLSVPVYGRMMHSKAGELAYQAYGQDDEKNLSISRSDLNKFLIAEAEKAGARFHFEHSLTELDFENRQIVFSNNKIHSYDVLFGTDGAGSQVRKKLCQSFPQEFSEKTEWLNADYKELFLPKPNSLNKKALHIWPRGTHMMMALGNLDGSFTVTLYLPPDRKESKAARYSFVDLKTDSSIIDFFKTEFPDSLALMPDFLEDFKSHPQGALGTVRCTNWTFQNSVCLMGDAAHAIVPFFGQGMNSGFEDCSELLKILDSQSTWDDIFQTFNQKQRPNAEAIADMAIENWIEMSEKVADPKFLLRKKIESVLERQFPELFKSRYGMVTYTLIPYHLVQKAGYLQEKIFEELLQGVGSFEEVSMEKAEKLLRENYLGFLNEHQMSFSKFT
jgi:kynurenine 3-monooxygenase